MVNSLENHLSYARLACGLRWIISLQCFGYAASLAVPSHLNSWLLPLQGDAFAGSVDTTIALILWVAGCALPFLGRASLPASQTKWSCPVVRCDAALLCFVAGWAFLNAVLSWQMNIEDKFAATDPFGHAVRFVAPVALLVFVTGTGSYLKLEWLFRIGIASTFIGHGLAAYWLKPGGEQRLEVGGGTRKIGHNSTSLDRANGFSVGLFNSSSNQVSENRCLVDGNLGICYGYFQINCVWYRALARSYYSCRQLGHSTIALVGDESHAQIH